MLRLIVLPGVLCLFCGVARAETVPFSATLAGASEVPPKTTAGAGTATATLDTATKMLTYDVEYSGLSGPRRALPRPGRAWGECRRGRAVSDAGQPDQGDRHADGCADVRPDGGQVVCQRAYRRQPRGRDPRADDARQVTRA